MRLLLCLLALWPLTSRAADIDLSGDWNFRIDSLDIGIREKWYLQTYDETVKLPGSMTTNGRYEMDELGSRFLVVP